MRFCEITPEQYEAFALTHPGRYYINSSKMIELKKKNGWNTYYTAVTDDDGKILAAAGFSAVPAARRYHYAYAQRGILCDFENHELTAFFTKNLQSFCKTHGMAYLRMDPYYEYQELTQDGAVREGGFCRRGVIDDLASMGWKHQGFYKGTVGDSQVRYMVVLDIADKTIDQLVMDFDPKTRRNIKRAEKLGVQIREMDPDHLEEFMKLMEFTSEKRNYEDMGLQAYRNQMEAFGPEHAKVIVSYLNMDHFHEMIDAERAEVNAELAKCDELLAETPGGAKATKRRNTALDLMKQIDAREEETNRLEKEYGKEIILSAAYFVIYDDEMYYISSGSYDAFRKYNGPYFIQNHAIAYAKEHGCIRYNFTGTSGVFDESGDDYGVFEFKRRFNGRPIELIGEFILPCDPSMMHKIQALTGLKKLLSHGK